MLLEMNCCEKICCGAAKLTLRGLRENVWAELAQTRAFCEISKKAVVSFPRLCSDRCLRKALREYWGFFSLRRIVIPSKYSRWLPVNKQSTEKMDSREEKALFSTTSMMITVLKDSALRYFKHRNVHWTDGHTRIHSGKRFHFMSNTFHVEVSGH